MLKDLLMTSQGDHHQSSIQSMRSSIQMPKQQKIDQLGKYETQRLTTDGIIRIDSILNQDTSHRDDIVPKTDVDYNKRARILRKNRDQLRPENMVVYSTQAPAQEYGNSQRKPRASDLSTKPWQREDAIRFLLKLKEKYNRMYRPKQSPSFIISEKEWKSQNRER